MAGSEYGMSSRDSRKTEFSSETGHLPFESDIQGTWGEVNVGMDYQANPALHSPSWQDIARFSAATVMGMTQCLGSCSIFREDAEQDRRSLLAA